MKDTGQDLKEPFNKAKEYVQNLPKKQKIIWSSVIAGILLLAVGLTVYLNIGKMGTKVLYQGLEPEEKNAIYSMLQEMGVSAQMNAEGNITVPAKEYDRCLIELAIKGYPHSAMTYGLFESHTGLTTTEAESKQWILYELQDRIQKTLKQMKSIQSSVVTISMPQESNYVWEKQDNKQVASASVLVHLHDELSPEQVEGIKTLVATGVPNLDAENVRVIDADTSKELRGKSSETSDFTTAVDNLTLELQVQRQIEENAERILAQRYGANGVVAVAKVELDYDKMMTEKMELQNKEDGNGFVKDFAEHYTQGGRVPAGGIVGEQNNTDIPQQVIGGENGESATTDYNREIHYDYGYIKTQVEKGNAALKNASIAVMVKETNMTPARRDELIALLSKSTGIEPENISVSPIDPNAAKEPETNTEQTTKVVVPMWVWLVSGGSILAIIIAVIVWMLLRKRAQRKVLKQQSELDEQRAQMEEEIAQYKKQLSDAAKASTNPKEEAIVNEVREFAKENPEITANLLRAWLKDGED